MHLSTQTIKLYSNLLSFSEPLKQAHRILTCGTAENKERLVKRKYISIFMHKFKMLGTNGCFVSFINFITDSIKRPTTKLFIPMVKGYPKGTQKAGFAQYSWSF